MNLSSVSFLILLAVCVIMFHLLPKSFRNYLLLAFSVFFCAYGMQTQPAQLLVLMVYIGIIFALGLLMVQNKERKTLYMAIGVVFSVVFLMSYKLLKAYSSFSIIVPIGLSYITFQAISYLVELKKGTINAMENPVDFFLFLLFFPKVTAGPIETPERFMDMLENGKVNYKKTLYGCVLIAEGFVKKIVIADILAVGVNAIYANPTGFDGLSVLLAIIMYSFQIYCDFAGYTDIARGASLLFGFELLENFDTPYLATSVVDFWKRWHISLTDWLRKYVYISLGGNRVGTVRRYLNVFVTFLVSGIWHGVTLNYIVWGMLHGFYQVVEIILRPAKKALIDKLEFDEDSVGVKGLGIIKTFILVTFTWIFFRAANISEAFDVIGAVFSAWAGPGKVLANCSLNAIKIVLIVFAVLYNFAIKLFVGKQDNSLLKTLLFCVIAVWLVIIATVVNFTTGGASIFIYFNY